MGEAETKIVRERFVLPQVQDIVDALVAQGMTPEQATKSVRWATYVLETRKVTA